MLRSHQQMLLSLQHTHRVEGEITELRKYLMRRLDKLWWSDASLHHTSTHQLWLTCSCPFYTPASPTPPCFPCSLHIGSSVGAVLLKPSNMQDAQVCMLISCKVQVCLRFLDRPSISVTDQVCFWWLFVNINWPNFMSLCVLSPSLSLSFKKTPNTKTQKSNQQTTTQKTFSHSTYPCLTTFILIMTSLNMLVRSLWLLWSDALTWVST